MRQVSLKTGILFVQLGTPDEATPQALKRYLKEFLSDPHVVETCPFMWWLILNGIILRTRPAKSAKLYERLFNNYGPILLTYTQSLIQKIQKEFDDSNLCFDFAMRYGNPSMQSVIEKMVYKDKCERLFVVPLFPQYSNSTTGSVYDKVFDIIKTIRHKPQIEFLSPFYAHPLYIESLAKDINDKLKSEKTPPEKLILSYHGIPVRYVNRGDPYDDHCQRTTQRLIPQINFPKENIIHCYQSRFGKEPWLQPYTDQTVEQFGDEGIKNVLVACPAFTMDCLETLDEIGVENLEAFKEHGGERLELVSCLNDKDHWIKNFAQIIKDQL